MQGNNKTQETNNYQFVCEKTNLPQEYINLERHAPLEDRLLCQKCAEKYMGTSTLIPIKEFIPKARRAFLSEKYLDVELYRKELKHLSDYYRLKFDHYRVAFIEVFLKLSQKVEKFVDTRISTLFHIAKENYLEKLLLFEKPQASYDAHSLLLSILKVLDVQEAKKGLNIEIKLTPDIKDELKKIQKDTKTELEPYDAMFEQLENLMAQLKDPSTFEYQGISITKWNFRSREHSHNGSIENSSVPFEPYALKTHISTPSLKAFQKETAELIGTTNSHSSKGKQNHKTSYDDSVQEMYEKALTHIGLSSSRSNNQKQEGSGEIHIEKVSEVALLKEMKLIKRLSLNLSGHQINQNNCIDIADAIKFQSDLEILKLDLSNNHPQMSRDAFREILSSISHLKSLRRLSLNLRINNFTPLEMTAISSFYSKMEHVHELDLLCSFNLLGDDGIKTFAKVISKHVKLKRLKLDFQKTKIASPGFKALFGALGHLKNMHTLSLVVSDNKICENDFVLLSNTLKELSDLMYLDIHTVSNDLKDEALSSLAKAVKDGLESLKQFGLDFQFNGAGYNGMKDLLNSIQEKMTLEKIAINFLDNKDLGSSRSNELKEIVQSISHCNIKCKL